MPRTLVMLTTWMVWRDWGILVEFRGRLRFSPKEPETAGTYDSSLPANVSQAQVSRQPISQSDFDTSCS